MTNRSVACYPLLFASVLFFSVYDRAAPLVGEEKESFTVARPRELEDARRLFLNAREGLAKGEAAELLVRGRTISELKGLLIDSDDGIALCAAWRRLEIRAAERLLNLDRAASQIQLSPVVISEFTGFVEGRLHITSPNSWLHNLHGARCSAFGVTTFPVLTNSPFFDRPKPLSEQMDPSRVVLPRVSLDFANPMSKLLIFGDDKTSGVTATIELPSSLRKAISSLKDRGRLQLSAIATRDRAIIAVQDSLAPGGMLVCIPHNQLTAKEESHWKTEMDASWFDDSKLSSVYTELMIHDEYVFLFHSRQGGVGVEKIGIETGKRLFSFNSWSDLRF
jgi:hypothetical protein